jgi:NAD(P)H-dependent FMN reductase
MTKKRILAISGSARINSANEVILRTIASRNKETLDVQIYDGITTLPYFNPDVQPENVPETVRHFLQLIEKADGVIICTPEYVFSLPGALKNAIEWTVATTVFSDKPAALIVASGAGEKAYESLVLIMKTVGVKLGPDSTLLIAGARSKINDHGEINDEKTSRGIDTLIQSFQDSMK